jgi:hypothetical protein
MGLTATDLDLLLELRAQNVPFTRIATIGSLSLYLHPMQLNRLKQLIPNSQAIEEYIWGQTADNIIKAVTGASEVVSIDVSDYQGATIVHDMNTPISEMRPDLAGSFDLIIDGGTLEHVFNFPVAISNLMFLVRKGGYILTANPANNLCGHGFYQFSPELMHRIYSEENGFRIHQVILTQARHLSVEMDPRPKSYSVADPVLLGRRILLRNHKPVMIRALAEKISDLPGTGLRVQQSDYVVAWSGVVLPKSQKTFKTVLRAVFHMLPMTMQSRMKDIVSRPTLYNGKVMRRWRGPLS